MKAQSQAHGVRELRLLVPDARTSDVRARVAKAVAALDRYDEADTLTWIEGISDFDSTDDVGAEHLIDDPASK